jgi:hypothetical protein
MNKKIFDAYNSLIEGNDIERLKKIIVRYELYKLSEDVPGDILECGVFKGTGHIFWLKLLKIFDSNSLKKVIGFDTFGDFPKSTLNFEKATAKKFQVEAKFNSKNLFKIISDKIEKINLESRSALVKGDIIKTSKKYVKDNRGFRISLLHLDLDTYEGTKHALNNFFPHVSPGGVIVFDEYGSRGWGESEAVDEFLNKKKLKLKKIKFSSKPTAYLIK